MTSGEVDEWEAELKEKINALGATAANIPIETAKALQFVYREQGSLTSKYRIRAKLRDMEDEEARDELIKDEKFERLADVTRPSYTDTRGIYVSQCYRVTISLNSKHFGHSVTLRML